MSLAKDISDELDRAIASATGENAIVKQFIQNLGGIPPPVGIKIETAFCHQKPYAFFVNPNRYAGKTKCELGDILWVHKILKGKKVTDHRAIFSQAKHSKTSRYHIDQHQYQFLKNINTNSFSFGKSVYKNAGYTPLIFHSLTKSKHFSNYLFLRPKTTPKCESTMKLPLLKRTSIDSTSLQDFEFYIGNFLTNRSFGMDLHKNKMGRAVVDIVFKRLGLVLDPPEEWQDYFVDDESGFGVVFITKYDD